MVLTPRLPGRASPLADSTNVILGINRSVNMTNGEPAPLSWRWIAGARQSLRPIEPLLDGLIGFNRAALLERGVHARQMRRIGLRRSHVLRRMLKRINVYGESVNSTVAKVPELPRQHFVKQVLTGLATAGHLGATFRAGPGRRCCRGHAADYAEAAELPPTPRLRWSRHRFSDVGRTFRSAATVFRVPSCLPPR